MDEDIDEVVVHFVVSGLRDAGVSFCDCGCGRA